MLLLIIGKSELTLMDKQSKRINIINLILSLLLAAYLVYIFYSTVFGRPSSGEYEYETSLFWSYRYVAETGSRSMLEQIIKNYLMLIPLGFVLPIILEGILSPKMTALVTILSGFIVTCLIEVLQLILMRGLFEFDDIFGNTIGTIIGYLLYRAFKAITTHKK